MSNIMPPVYRDKTNGYILKRYKTFSDNSRLFLGGITGMLLFAYDKVGTIGEIIEAALGAFGILCFFTSFAAFKIAADDLEDRIERDELLNAPFGIDGGKKPLREAIYNPKEWPGIDYRLFYKPGLIIIGVLAFFIFAIGPFINPHKDSARPPLCNCKCYADTGKKPPAVTKLPVKKQQP